MLDVLEVGQGNVKAGGSDAFKGGDHPACLVYTEPLHTCPRRASLFLLSL